MLTRWLLPLLWLAPMMPGRSDAQVGVDSVQTMVRGRVEDAARHLALADAYISISDDARVLATGLSDSAGHFELVVPSRGMYAVRVRRLGYEPAEGRVPAESLTVPLTVRLRPAPHALEAVDVLAKGRTSSRLAGFEARSNEGGGGTYITRQDIERWHPGRMTNLMRRVNGVHLWDSSGTLLVVSGRGEKVDLRKGILMANCVMRVAVDGAMKEWGFPIDLIPPEDVHGIEIYGGPATIPSEFNGLRPDSYCGLIMIWTRSAP